ncbi:MAG: apolipoprotein N-acyltransferase, partial [Pseudomonadota bacterium]
MSAPAARSWARRIASPVAAFAAGLACAAAMPHWSIWSLGVVGLAGFAALAARASNRRSALWRGWAFGLGFFGLGLFWIGFSF